MKIFVLDDLRNIAADVTCRTATAAYIILQRSATFDVYYFDHDLGSTEPGTSGYDVLCWAIEQHKYIPIGAYVCLVTSNPVGRHKMELALASNGFVKIYNKWERVK